MTFEEAYDRLNARDITSVAAEMVDWHPAILGNMLLAVQAAKLVRYGLSHPDYYSSLQACLGTEPQPDASTARFGFGRATIATAVKWLQNSASGIGHTSHNGLTK